MTKYDQFKCWIKYRLFHKKRTLKQTQEFWNKAEGDNWNKYKEGIGKSKFFHNLIAFIPLSKHTRILELGCNVGRNLNYLRSKGFTNLTGIELNSEAVKNSLKGFKIFNSSIEDYLRNFDFYNGRIRTLTTRKRMDICRDGQESKTHYHD